MTAHIDPEAIPGVGLDPDAVAEAAGSLRSIASSVRDDGAAVLAAWRGLSGVYDAPESGTVLGLMDPVGSMSTATGDGLDVVAGALADFAEAVRPVKAQLDALRVQAQAFVDTQVAHGVQVRELNPAWVTANSYARYGGYGPAGSGLAGSGGYGASSAGQVPQYRTVTRSWDEVQSAVDENNDLIHQVNAQQVLLWEAERACANRIRTLYGAAALHAATGEDDAYGYGVDEIPDGTEMPWGAEVDRAESCGEATVGAVKGFVWDGVIVGGIWGTIQGLGTLVLGYNPATGEWFSGDAYGAAWGNLGLLGADLVMNSAPASLVFAADAVSQAAGGDGFLPDAVRDFKAKADDAAINTGKALIAWDEWSQDPAKAAGEVVFNLGTVLIPAGGAAVAGVKTGGTAARVAGTAARVVDLVDPATWVMKGAVSGGGFVFKGVGGLLGKLDVPAFRGLDGLDGVGGLTRFDGLDGVSGLERVDGAPGVFRAQDPAVAVDGLIDGLGVPAEQIRVDLTGDAPSLVAPGARVELPAGAFDHTTGYGGAQADAAATVPAREPVLVQEPVLVGAGHAGADAAGSGPRVVDTIVDDAPARAETISTETATTGGGHRGGETTSTGGGHGGGETTTTGGGHRGGEATSTGGSGGAGHGGGSGSDGSASGAGRDATPGAAHGADGADDAGAHTELDGSGPDGASASGPQEGGGEPGPDGADPSHSRPGDGSGGAGGQAGGVPPGRTYTLADGTDYTTRWAPEQVEGWNSAYTELDDALVGTGRTMDDLVDLIHRPTATLSASDVSFLHDLRTSIGWDDSTVFQKVIPPGEAEARAFTGTYQYAPDSLQGFVTRLQDVTHFANSQDVFTGLRLDYDNSQFHSILDGPMQMIRYERAAGGVDIPFNDGMAGHPTGFNDPAPFTGNGFTGSGIPHSDGNVVPEFYARQTTVKDFAEMWEVTPSGTYRLLAVFQQGGGWTHVADAWRHVTSVGGP